MENIIEPNDNFDFSKLSLSHPISIQGGAYFTKIQYNNKPVYIQTTKSLTRQGLVKTGKKYYCDLMFDQTSIPLINWFEKLEERCQELMYEKADKWFQTVLEKNDVESAFNSIIRIFKSGKFYLVRTNIKSSSINNEPIVKIYNENELPIAFQEITNETNIISILEIQGIKFTSRNFQIEIELKQMMVLDNEPIFDSCLIKTTKKEKEIVKEPEENLEKPNVAEDIFMNEEPSLEKMENSSTGEIEKEIELQNEELPFVEQSQLVLSAESSNQEEESTPSIVDNELTESLELNIEELEPPLMDDNIQEVTFESTLENPLETITLKKPNQVYFELYKEARTKAKEAKKNLILAYLEAKNIKKTYLLDDFDNNSDSDLDAEIDEISESELEGL
jgi:hypothetical protein